LITYIYNYVDFSQINPQKPKSLNFDEKNTFLLSVAQHRKNKNIDLLIQAFSELEKSKSLKNITKLIIVGSTGPETDNLKTQISELSLQEKVILFDSITDSELCWLYQNCHLFVAPSSQEGFCLPLAEAMSFSCNIVCSDIPIFREIAASNCTYFQINTNSVQNLSQAIAKSLENHDQKNYQELRFSKTKIAKQYLDFYSKLIVN
jgi:glycosyltransferase involved in cell wall biosynthesis